ncbi:MAG: potassium channel protein [Deltaproteobacteria bacterium]|nr:potassium channel protein [Deltaproteobacteria bacterium]
MTVILGLGVIGAGTIGYMVIEHWSFLDALFMTAISLTTVGYGEIHPLHPSGRVFTVILLLVGVGLILFIVTRLTEIIVEGNFRKLMGRRKMDRQIATLKDHFIICGYGRIGRIVNLVLRGRGLETVIIERESELTAQLDEEVKYVLGEATDDQTLLRAGLAQARGLVAAVNSDADNVYICLTVRELRPDINIIARAGESAAKAKLLRAGANQVIAPYDIGARQIAQTILRPTVSSFLDLTMSDDRQVQVQVEELKVGPKAELAGKTLKNSGIRAALNLIIVAVLSAEGEMHFNPGPDDVIEIGSILIAIGPADKLKRLGQLLDASAVRVRI